MKRMIKLFAGAMMLVSLVGCKETPESPIVIGKDYEQMMSQAVLGQPTDDSIGEQVGAKEKYTLDGSLKNAVENIEVYVDADVVISKSSTMTTAKVSRHSFSLEESKKYIEILFNGQKTYSGETAIAKPALLKKIERVKAELAECTDEEVALKLQATLEKYELELNGMVDGNGMVEKAVEFTVNKDNYNEEQLYLVSDGSDGIYRSIKISNHDEFRSYGLIYQVSKNGYPEISGLCSTSSAGLDYGKEVYGNPDELPKLIKSEEEAISDANKVLVDLGINDFVAKKTDIVFGEINGEVQKAYRISFMRTVNGVSFNYSGISESMYGSGNAVDDGKGGKMPVWENETVTFIVANEGVVQFELLNLLNIEEIVTEYTKMMDFESIMDIFERMILIHYANVPEGTKLEIEIDRIELGLMRILEPNTLDSGAIVPVWDFYGNTKTEDDEYSDRTYITINAIDGTIINRGLGY